MYDNERNTDQSIAEDTSYENDYSSYYEQPEQSTSVAKIVVALLVLFGVVGILALQYPKFVKKITGNKVHSVAAAESIPVEGEMIAENPDENMGDFFYNEAGGEGQDGGNGDGNPNPEWQEGNPEGNPNPEWQEGNPDEMAQGQDMPQEEGNNGDGAINFGEGGEDNSLMVSLGTSGRTHPFLPHKRVKIRTGQSSEFASVPFEIIEPPSMLAYDPNISRLLETQITGILYDKESPSAIVVIDGVDEFVKVGDKIFGYTISEITPDKVVISYGKNTLTASIGQLFSQQELTNGRVVSNLERKFSGSRR